MKLLLSCLKALAVPSVLWFCFLPLVQAQEAQIGGRVTDPSGAVVPQTDVTVKNTATGVQRKTQSNDEGYYLIPLLQPGNYTLTAQKAGFRPVSQEGIVLQVGDRTTLNLHMEVGTLTDSVTITAEVPLMRTEDAQTGQVVNNTMIQNLPQLQRDPLHLLLLSGNIQGSGSRAQPGSDTRINGGRTIGIEYRIDGITAGTGLGHKVADTTPTMEMVSEFKVVTNGVSAEYGRFSGGVVEVATQRGANSVHGQLFEYFQNDHLNANSWAQNAQGGSKVKFAQNIFGGAVGGPVYVPKVYTGRNRTFFFANYEGLRRVQAGSLMVASVPTELERKGDFSKTMYNYQQWLMYDQNGPVVFDQKTNSWIRQQLIGDGLHMPPSMIHPVSLAVLKDVPLPNRSPTPGTSSIGNYAAPRGSRANRNLASFRLDHNITDAHRLFGRFLHRDSTSGNDRWRGRASTASENNSKGALGVALNYDWTVSPSLLLNARAGVNHWPNSSGNLLPADYSSAGIPFDAITRAVMGYSNTPTVDADDSILADTASLNVNNYTTYDANMSITKIAGRHTIKTGFQHNRFFDNYATSANGNYTFLGNPVYQIAGVELGDADEAYGLATAAYMIGVNDRAFVFGGTTRANNFNYYGVYFQDDFKVSPKLTVNLGLRWDMESPLTERYDKLYVWDPAASAPFKINSGYNFTAEVTKVGLDPARVRKPAWVTQGFPTGAIRIANTPEYPSRNGWDYRWTQFTPRIGAAYQLNAKTTLRGSFGMIRMPTSGAENAFQGQDLKLAAGADAGWHASDDNLIHLISNWTTPYKPGQFTPYVRTNAAANYDATSPTSPAGFNRDQRMPTEYVWNFGVQRALPRGFVVEAVYNANLGRNLLGSNVVGRFPKDLFVGGTAGENYRTYTTQIASPTAGQTLSNSVVGEMQNLAVLQGERPYFGPVTIKHSNLGRSNYHGINLRVERRFATDLYVLFNYTLSKLLDDVGGTNVSSSLGNAGTELSSKRPQTIDNTTDVYGLSALDETHVVRFAFNYGLPVGRGKRLLSSPGSIGSKILDGAIGGWELAGVGSIRSGRPVILAASNVNINNNIRVEATYGNFIDPTNPTINNPAFVSKDQVLFSSRDVIPSSVQRRFYNAANAKQFVYGDLPPIFPRTRHPSNENYDVSLMKAFYFRESRAQYLQLRMEGTNFFNIRGWGSYGTTIGTRNFGLISSAGNSPRTIQVSMRLVF
jgi:hypothetical protein